MIRSYRPTDLEDLLRVWAAASAVAHPFLSEELLESERRDIPDVHLPNAETWVWEAGGRVVGFIALIGNEVGAIFVDPKFHRSGIGRALMDRARALRGELEVEVFKANTLGRAFYASYGFELMREEIHGPTGLEILRLRLRAKAPLQGSPG
jgi:putative acetyltransferase